MSVAGGQLKKKKKHANPSYKATKHIKRTFLISDYFQFKVTANVQGLVLLQKIFLTKRKIIIKANIFRKNEHKISNRARVIEKKRFF